MNNVIAIEFQIYSKPVLRSPSETVYFVQSQPKLAIQITEAMLVVTPATIKIDKAVQSSLDHCPSSNSRTLVTVHIKGT